MKKSKPVDQDLEYGLTYDGIMGMEVDELVPLLLAIRERLVILEDYKPPLVRKGLVKDSAIIDLNVRRGRLAMAENDIADRLGYPRWKPPPPQPLSPLTGHRRARVRREKRSDLDLGAS